MSTADSSPRHTLVTPANPFMPDGLSTLAVGEAIRNCAAVSYLVADLFGTESDTYTVFACERSRYGAWLLLSSIGQALDFISEISGNAAWPTDRPPVDTR